MGNPFIMLLNLLQNLANGVKFFLTQKSGTEVLSPLKKRGDLAGFYLVILTPGLPFPMGE
jgi:hypothetical protein